MGRKMEPDVLATAAAQTVPGTPETPAAAASPATVPAAAVKPVAAAAAAVMADPGTAAPKVAKKSRSAPAPAGTATPAAAVKTARSVRAELPEAVKAPRLEAAVEPVKQEKQEKQDKEKAHAKPKLVRDSFTMPRADFALVALLKDRALGFKRPVKKSELLRAGLHALAALDDTKLQAALAELTPLKAGRPKKG